MKWKNLAGSPVIPPEGVLLGVVSGTVEAAYFILLSAAYRRGDLFEKRRKLMGDWAQYLSSHGFAVLAPQWLFLQESIGGPTPFTTIVPAPWMPTCGYRRSMPG